MSTAGILFCRLGEVARFLKRDASGPLGLMDGHIVDDPLTLHGHRGREGLPHELREVGL